ncbi:MAG: DUF3379 family protein [Pseudomonadota bacterium]
MDFEQYKIYLNADPRSREPEFLEASRSSIQNASAHAAAQEFEDKLESALRVPVPSPSVETILAHCFTDEESSHSYRPPTWLAMAAAVLVLVGVASVILPRGPQVDAFAREAFVAHLEHPEPAAFANDRPLPPPMVAQGFTSQGVSLEEAIADVTYLSPCVIGEKRGLHLVLTDDTGDKVTVMLLPGEPMEEKHNFSMDQVTVQMMPTGAGALALFGHQGQDLSPLARQLARDLNRSNNLVASL